MHVCIFVCACPSEILQACSIRTGTPVTHTGVNSQSAVILASLSQDCTLPDLFPTSDPSQPQWTSVPSVKPSLRFYFYPGVTSDTFIFIYLSPSRSLFVSISLRLPQNLSFNSGPTCTPMRTHIDAKTCWYSSYYLCVNYPEVWMCVSMRSPELPGPQALIRTGTSDGEAAALQHKLLSPSGGEGLPNIENLI